MVVRFRMLLGFAFKSGDFSTLILSATFSSFPSFPYLFKGDFSRWQTDFRLYTAFVTFFSLVFPSFFLFFEVG